MHTPLLLVRWTWGRGEEDTAARLFGISYETLITRSRVLARSFRSRKQVFFQNRLGPLAYPYLDHHS
jgi:predicted nucleotidyltransferase